MSDETYEAAANPGIPASFYVGDATTNTPIAVGCDRPMTAPLASDLVATELREVRSVIAEIELLAFGENAVAVGERALKCEDPRVGTFAARFLGHTELSFSSMKRTMLRASTVFARTKSS